jgi:predicted RNA binding protein YcfA (HicA-like mRNA interferase family)
VSKHEKRVKELLKLPPQMRFDDVEAILTHLGYKRTGGKGSHNRFENSLGQVIDTPTVNGRFVKRVYLKKIAEDLKLEQ